MTSTQLFPHTVSKQLNRDNGKSGAFRREVFYWFSVNSTAQGLVVTLGLIGYSMRSTYWLNYLPNSSINPILLSMIGLTLKSFLGSVLARGMLNDASNVLFLFFVL